MNFEMPNFMLALPEVFLLGMICLILILDLFIKEQYKVVTYLVTQATLVVLFMMQLSIYTSGSEITFSGSFILDPMASLLKLFIYGVVGATFIYARDYLAQRNMLQGEFFVLALSAVLGMMVMVSANSFLTLYVGLELLSLSLYAMVALQRDSGVASEAAMKYFVLGAMASAMLLYGMSMIYGATGTLQLDQVKASIAAGSELPMVLTFGLVFMLVGVGFKLGAVPFHMWVPDVYHGASTAVTAFISTAPKLAAFAMMMRLLVDALPGLYTEWHQIITIMALLSIIVGNVVAIAQTNLKRMLAYSGISHIGFMLLGMLAATPEGYSAAMYYAIVYAIMGMGGFGLVIVMSRAGFEADSLDDYKGLNQRSPWIALMLLFLMFSMAGVPPFLGFWAKLAVIEAVISVDMVWLAVVAVLFSVIGAFYYLRLIKLAYFDSPTEPSMHKPALDLRLIFSLNALLVLVLGLFPNGLMQMVSSVFIG